MVQSLDQFASDTDAVFMAVEARLAALFTALPALLTQAGDGHTATAKSALLGLVRQDDQTTQQMTMPGFETMPVHFAGGGQVIATHPLHAGDEGIALFFARAMDSWHQSGGVNAPIDSRAHHLSDGVFLNGLRSDPNKLANYAPDSIQHRSKDGKVTHDVHPTNGTTTKVVDPSDSAPNPFTGATKYHETTHNPSSGVKHRAKDETNDHTVQLERAAGFLASVIRGSTASHTMNLTPSGGFSTSASDPMAGTSSSVSAHPDGTLSLAATNGLNLPAGGVSAAALAAGAASSNVGALGGDLSGTLPNPSVVGISHVAGANSLTNAANDAAAATAGVAIGHLYRNGSQLMVRVT